MDCSCTADAAVRRVALVLVADHGRSLVVTSAPLVTISASTPLWMWSCKASRIGPRVTSQPHSSAISCRSRSGAGSALASRDERAPAADGMDDALIGEQPERSLNR